MNEKYMQSEWIGENKMKPHVDTCRFNQKKGEFETMSDMQQLIDTQKMYISTLEEGIDLRDRLIEKYEKTIYLQEKRIELLENMLNAKDEQNKKLVGIIEDYKALCRSIAGLEDE